MEKELTQLKNILAEVADLQGASSLLGWDQQVNMPAGGAKARGQIMGTLRSLSHQKFTSAETGKLLEALEAQAGSLEPDSDEARLLKVTRRRFDKSTRVPREYLVEMAQTTSRPPARQARSGSRPARRTILPNSSRSWKKSSSCASVTPPSLSRTNTSTTRCWTISSLALRRKKCRPFSRGCVPSKPL